MKGFMKGMCLTAAFLVTVGIVLGIIGFCFGGQFHNVYFDQSGIHYDEIGSESHEYNGWRMNFFNIGNSHHNSNDAQSYSDNTKKELDVGNDDINSLSVELGAVEAIITEGDKFELRIDGNASVNSHIQGDKLVFDMPNKNIGLIGNDIHSKVYITVPKNKTFDDISLNIGAGSLKATDLRAESAVLNAGAGEMILDGFICEGDTDITVGMASFELNGDLQGKTSIDCGMGDCSISLTDSSDIGYSADVGMGNVSVLNENVSLIGDAEHNKGAKRFFAINCGMGNVEIS
ncbi:MAG: hypothetical protein RR573_05450 [Oscillospiraceae bacterium]